MIPDGTSLPDALAVLALATLVVPTVVLSVVPRLRRRRSPRPWVAAGRIYTGFAILCVALVVSGFPAPVLLVVAALNLTLGRGEAVPFSTFPMFGSPKDRGFTIRLTGPDGVALSSAQVFGMAPSTFMKRFRRELALARDRPDPEEHRPPEVAAAASLIEGLVARRPLSPPPEFRLELTDLVYDGGAVTATTRTIYDGPAS